jgi:hypothetical protein
MACIEYDNPHMQIGLYLIHLVILLDVQVSTPVSKVCGVPADMHIGVWSILPSVSAVLAPG